MIRQFILGLILSAVIVGQVRIPGPGGSASGGGGAFAPTDLSGLMTWYKADGTVNCVGGAACANGESVTTWVGSAGNGNNLANCTSRSPVYHTNHINSLPAVVFAGTDTNGECMTFTTPLTPGSKTIFAVVKLTGTGTKGMIVSGNAGSIGYWMANTGPKLHGIDDVFVAQIGLSTSNADTNWHQINVTYNGSAYAFRLDRAADGSGTNAQTITDNQTVIGRNDQGGYEYFLGELAEIFIYSRVLSGAEITSVETYLNTKYGL